MLEIVFNEIIQKNYERGPLANVPRIIKTSINQNLISFGQVVHSQEFRTILNCTAVFL